MVKSVLDKAVLPYVRTLETWTTRGEIHDPYDEFMVLEKSTVRKEDLNAEYNDAYWETRYRVRGDTRGTDIPATSLEELRAAFHAPASDAEGARDREAVPFFLKSMEETVLLCGKYLNVIRECGRSVGRPVVLAAPAPSALTAGNPMTRVVERVHAAYKSANAAVLKLLFEEHHLVARLR